MSDETLNKLFRVHADGRKEEMIALGDPDGNTYDRQHRLLDCASVLRAIIRFKPDGKSYETVTDRFEGKRFNSPNDVVIGPAGAIYFTDPTLDLVAGEKQEIPYQGVYRVDSKGNVQLLTKDLSQPETDSHFHLMANVCISTTASNGTFAFTIFKRMAQSRMEGSSELSLAAKKTEYPMV